MEFHKLTEAEIDELSKSGKVGYYGEFGAIIGEHENVITEGKNGVFLIPKSEFEHHGIGVQISERALQAIGGLPETEAEKFAKKLGVSVECASDVIYLRSRSRWTQELEDKLIQAHKNGESVNVFEFGCTEETGQNLVRAAKEMM